jgi:hypothetical protein
VGQDRGKTYRGRDMPLSGPRGEETINRLFVLILEAAVLLIILMYLSQIR